MNLTEYVSLRHRCQAADCTKAGYKRADLDRVYCVRHGVVIARALRLMEGVRQ